MGIIDPQTIRDLYDGRLRVTQPGMDTYLRITPDISKDTKLEFMEFGFQVPDDNFAAVDLMIDPPASVTAMSMRDIGLDNASLKFGAHQFEISHTFVQQMMQLLGVDNGWNVWNHQRILGFVYNSRLFSIASTTPRAVGGEVIKWIVLANQLDIDSE